MRNLTTMLAVAACAVFAMSAMSEADNTLSTNRVGTSNGQVQALSANRGMPGEIIRAVNGSSIAGGDDVLIAAAPGTFPGWAQDVADQIASTGKVSGNIDLFDASTGTPTPEQLADYSCVLTFTDRGYANAIAMGDAMADFVDNGGGVVQAVFSWHTSIPLGGRWQSDGYSVMTYAAQVTGNVTIGTRHIPNHPVLADVDTFSGGTSSYRNTGVFSDDAVQIADWSNDEPLVGEIDSKNGGIIGLNFYPPSSIARGDFWEDSTDGEHLLANALVYASGGSTSCNYTIKKSKAKKGCNSCPAKGDNYESEAGCETAKDCVKKVKTTITCPNGPGKCKITAKKRRCE